MKSRFYSQIWKEAPFIRLLIPLVAGILLQYFSPITKSFNGLTLVCGALTLICSLFIPLHSFFGWGWIMGICISITFLSLGRLLLYNQQDTGIAGSFRDSLPENYLLIARLEDDPVRKSGSFKSTATIQYLCAGNNCYREKEKIFIYFQTDSLSKKISPGVMILFRKPLLPIKNAGASGFDYKRYCRLKHIYARTFLKTTDYSTLGKEKGNFFSSCLISWRSELLRILRLYVPDKEENSLLEALMIGYTNDLDRALVQSYSNTGVIHIIAISGLHLALIYQILQLLLQKISNHKSYKWLKLIILLGSLWTFSLLSGASPSVIRSATMFSIMLLARNTSRESAIYNSLASSAFLLLCFDPFWLWDTGFQLSYSAVLSLVIFLKPIRRLFHIQNRLLDELWNTAAVSLAAQILTIPISLFYFHQFPNYFLFTNLLAVPLSGVMLVGCILLCSFSFSACLAGAIGWVLGKLTWILNGFIQYTARLPGAVTERISVNLFQVILLYILLYCICQFLKSGRKNGDHLNHYLSPVDE